MSNILIISKFISEKNKKEKKIFSNYNF